ncbi:Nxf1p [Dermatophagoides pteronyssinus]|uniref:Nxf1p n=1 Tax=Dermatophagoides pteronyssinus TaxID=6956 RepID=A0ABQ8JHX0_DERPT|nr:Nxf1p [Dermatophagoides pteronyssinus]
MMSRKPRPQQQQQHQQQQQYFHKNSQQPNNNRRRQYNDNQQQSYNDHDDRSNVHNRLGPRRRNIRGSGGNYRQTSSRNNRSQNYNNNKDANNRRSGDDFFKVTIPNGHKYEQAYIRQLLKENLDDMDDEIIFYNYHIGQNNCVFYVNGQDKADTLRGLSRRIKTNSGHNLIILTQRTPPPVIQMNDQYIELIKIAMSSQYDHHTNIMDLSQFTHSKHLKSQGLYIMLNRPNVLANIVRLIIDNAPNTIAINLSDNKIQILEPLKDLSSLTQLKALNLSKNNINNFEQLDHIKHLDLLELDLEGNPLINNYQSSAAYVSAIRKIFKNLKTLDKEALPTEIGFDLAVADNIPEKKGSFIPDESLKTFITGFLKEYFRMYDSDSRQQLMVAYHDSATFTHSIASNNSMYRPNDIIMKESHNLLRLRDESLWVKLVKTSNVDIVSFLNKLPVTKHHLDTFQVDIPFFSKEFINVVVNGLLQETLKTQSSFRSFCRTFFLVPHNNGFVILNEMLLISSPSIKQINEHKPLIEKETSSNKADLVMKNFDFKPSNLIVTSNLITNQSNVTFASSAPKLPNDPREEIIRKFKEETKMNRQFSIQCLEENGFNPAVAYDVFLKLKQANALPPEAFID